MQSDEMIGNGLPTLLHTSSEDIASPGPTPAISDPPREGISRRKKKKKKAASPNSLLSLMNNNIRTLRRVRTTHAKFAALQQTEDGNASTQPALLPTEEVEEVLDEQPWKPVGSGLEMGEENADECLHWMSTKVLEHAGFQGGQVLFMIYQPFVTSVAS